MERERFLFLAFLEEEEEEEEEEEGVVVVVGGAEDLPLSWLLLSLVLLGLLALVVLLDCCLLWSVLVNGCWNKQKKWFYTVRITMHVYAWPVLDPMAIC